MVVTEDRLLRYRTVLERLLPRGLAWTRRPGGPREKLLEALAESAATIDDRAELLLELEADPRKASELLEEWLEFVGLPDECSGDLETALAKRSAIVARLVTLADPSPAGFTALALTLGYVVSIVEYRPFEVGRSAVGDALNNDDEVFTWTVVAPQLSPIFATAGFAVIGDPLVETGNDLLECTLRDLKPSHTNVEFDYSTLLWTGYAPWNPYSLAPVASSVAPVQQFPTLTLGSPP